MGGGCQSAELTLPGFVHDVCSAVHPFAVVSPFFQSLPLSQHGLEWITPPVMLAHPLVEGPAACLHGSVERTGEGLGQDEAAYRELFDPLVKSWPKIAEAVLGPLRWPRHPRRELAIRLAVGAQPTSVVWLAQRGAAVLAAVGAAASFALATAASTLLGSLLVGIGPVDPAAFGVALALLAAVIFLASWTPARRAAGMDPVEALRAE